MRLFLACFAKIYEYEKFQKEFGKHFVGNWTKEENLHITFAFLGDVKEPSLVQKALEGIEYPKNKRIEFNDLELFKNSPDVLYCTTNSKDLETLHKDILQRLEFLKLETKEYIPHVSLLRIKDIKDHSYTEYLDSFEDRKVGFIKLNLALVKSTLSDNGPIYETIAKF